MSERSLHQNHYQFATIDELVINSTDIAQVFVVIFKFNSVCETSWLQAERENFACDKKNNSSSD